MDKRTLLAVVLSVIVITGGFMIQNILFPPQPTESTGQTEAVVAEQAETTTAESAQPAQVQESTDTPQPQPVLSSGAAVVPVEADIESRLVSYRNDVMEVVIDTAGARVMSLKLLEHQDGDQPVELIMSGDTGEGAFELRFGNENAPRVLVPFRVVASTDPNVMIFERAFVVPEVSSEPFVVRRTYRFYPDEYMFEVRLSFENSENAYVPLNFNGESYTLSTGPQIGPSYATLDNRNEFRRVSYFLDGKKKDVRLRSEDRETITDRVQWIGVNGKYFALLGVPDSTDYTFVASNETPEGLRDGTTVYYVRPSFRSAAVEDVFRFYAGPKVGRVLNRYNDPDDNSLGVRNLNLDTVQQTRVLFGWLENILKAVMQLLYRIVPNYGIAIILLTILVKIVLFPLTHKSYESTSKMQALSPKINELREKYKDNPQKMNAEMAEMYKKNGVNPVGGCLPMLLQFPFFIAMFGLFNNHFDLRGATFIPGWIDDLSVPESIWNFGGFELPLLGWTDLRLLPIVFVGSQLLSSKLMQTPTATSNSQTQMMQYGLPIMFFFILYNMPSGLLVYWIFSNVLTVGQQYYINQARKRRASET